MSKKISLTELKKSIKKKTDYELVEEVAHLYKTFPQVKEYYSASFFNDDASVLENYKQKIKDEFVPGCKYNLPRGRLSIGRKAIADYKKVSTSDIGIADIMLTYVESGIIFTTAFGDIDEPFYISMETMYEKACKFIKKKGLYDKFENRLKKCLKDTRQMGWGFHDQLNDIYDIELGDYPT